MIRFKQMENTAPNNNITFLTRRNRMLSSNLEANRQAVGRCGEEMNEK